ncbi:hypothetical protein C8R48DRAFT_770544 [Suillus tomentosus]|nr:hypothetical protein C8R48DRAFT_770544 [Suillus tomentosus]
MSASAPYAVSPVSLSPVASFRLESSVILYLTSSSTNLCRRTYLDVETYPRRLIATETHILTSLTMVNQLDERGNSRAIIQTFALPWAGITTASPPTIELTHEGRCHLNIERISLLRDPTTSAITGQTQIKSTLTS